MRVCKWCCSTVAIRCYSSPSLIVAPQSDSGKSTIEVMSADVSRDGLGQQLVSRQTDRFCIAHLVANLRRADVDLQAGQQVKRRAVASRIAQLVASEFDSRLNRAGFRGQ